MKNNIFNNMLLVSGGNIVFLLISVFQGFFFPFLLSVQDYGILKLIQLYLTYAGILQLGFSDGYLLQSCNKERFDNKANLRFLIFLTVANGLICSFFLYILSDNLSDIIIYLIPSAILQNIFSYINYHYQSAKNFKRFMMLFAGRKILFFLIAAVFIYKPLRNYKAVIIIDAIYLFIIFIVFYKSLNSIEVKNDSTHNIKRMIQLNRIGLPIMLGNLSFSLLVGFDKLFIGNLFSLEEFAYYSFACMVVGLITKILSSSSEIIIPYLADREEKVLMSITENITIIICVISVLFLSSFFLIKFALLKLLPEYKSSLTIMSIIYPLIIPYSIVRLVLSKNQIVRGKSKIYLNLNAIFLFIILICFILFALNKLSIIWYPICFTIITYIWLLFQLLSCHINKSFIRNVLLYLFISMLYFYMLVHIVNLNIGILFITYLISIIILSAFFYSKEIRYLSLINMKMIKQ